MKHEATSRSKYSSTGQYLQGVTHSDTGTKSCQADNLWCIAETVLPLLLFMESQWSLESRKDL